MVFQYIGLWAFPLFVDYNTYTAVQRTQIVKSFYKNNESTITLRACGMKPIFD